MIIERLGFILLRGSLILAHSLGIFRQTSSQPLVHGTAVGRGHALQEIQRFRGG
ncbi:hypothetical protein HAP93_05205 [Acidithiobacillus ferriphilus]|uniref:hypothetical protein n=1 Tax=Acidithiobacillus ferriphilus TaxID=1689834 RepID=UPI001C0604E8|nr:hypothetical protein [Acidithiobacillus ferriphilus]MBU2785169.1 hypothetical protein [Acidithiobacillus ferriphilus]